MKRRAFLETAGAGAVLSVLTGACFHRDRRWPLRVGINDWIGYQVISAAQALGFWEQRNLAVDLIEFNNLEDSTRALYRGGLDATFTTLWDLLQLCQEEENAHPVVLWVTNISYGSDGIVVRPPYRSVIFPMRSPFSISAPALSTAPSSGNRFWEKWPERLAAKLFITRDKLIVW